MLCNAKCTVNVESYISDKSFVFYFSQIHTCGNWKKNCEMESSFICISYQWWIVHWTTIDIGSNFMEVLFHHVATPSYSVGKERFPSSYEQ